MTINVAAAGKTAAVIVTVWAVMLGTAAVRETAAMMAPTRDVGMTLNEGTKGPVVEAVASGSEADKAGIKPGDVVVAVNRIQVHNFADYRKRLGSVEAGEQLAFSIERNGVVKRLVMGEDLAAKAAAVRAAAVAPSPIGVQVAAPDISWRVGVQLGDAGERGPVVREIEVGSLADVAGIKVGDVLTAINGQGFIDTFGAADQLKSHRKGNLTVQILRNGEPKTLTIVRENTPAATAQSAADKVYGQLK